MSRGGYGDALEPMNGKDVARYLIRQHGARPIPSAGLGSDHHTFEFPDGRKHNVPGAGVVTRPFLKRLAEFLGLSYAELRAGLGHPVLTAGKVQRHAGPVKKQEPTYATKGQALRLIRDVAVALRGIESTLAFGDRDSATYGRLVEDLTALHRRLVALNPQEKAS